MTEEEITRLATVRTVRWDQKVLYLDNPPDVPNWVRERMAKAMDERIERDLRALLTPAPRPRSVWPGIRFDVV